MSNITLNIVAPDTPTPTPVDPGIDPSVPSTGLFTHGIGTTETTIITIVSAVLLLTIVAVVVAILYKKHKAQNKTTKLVHLVDSTKAIITNKKRVTATLTAIALLVSAGTFIALAKNAVNATESDEQTSQAEGDDSSLTVDVSSEELTIEVGSEPVFAVLPVEVSVEEATQAGYTLTAYADSTDLVSTTDPDNTIPMIAVDEADLSENELATLAPLADNTYGLALGEEPTSKDAEVYTSLSTDSLNPTIIKSMTEYTPTPANDTTTIYYGFYITPDIPYGTYTNDGEVYYNATINTTLVTFDGKGLYFDEEQTQSTNTVEYIAVSQDNNETETSSTINQPISGEYKTPSQSLPYRFLGWSTDPTATTPTYTSEDDITEHLPISPNIPLTLYAVWQKATTITFDSNDGAGDKTTQTIIAGESDNLNPNEFTREGYIFTGWNTESEPTEQEPGKTYADQAEYTAPADSGYVTLYAQWVVPPTDLTFTAGEHIDTLMVADSSQNWKPFYVTPTSVDRSIVFTAPAEDTKYIITVVPEAGYVLSSDSTNSSYGVAFSTGTLASNTLLTTTYTAGSAGDNVTISAAQAGNDSAHPAYTTMQSLTTAQCPVYTDSTQGINVTDSRDNKSYTVAKFGNYCYMLSNLRLDGGTELATDTSNVSSSYTLPADTGSGGWDNDACQPRMASANGEYYYNWPAATARTNSTSGSNSCYNDTSNSVGDICPAGWSLPTYDDITSDSLWNSGTNPGMLSTSGYFLSGSQSNVGGSGGWWSSTRYNHNNAYRPDFDGSSAYRVNNNKNFGFSVRCMRSS